TAAMWGARGASGYNRTCFARRRRPSRCWRADVGLWDVTPLSVEEGDGAAGGAVGAVELEGEGDEAAARRTDLVEVGQVLDDGDPGGEEDVVRGALIACHLLPRLEDGGAHGVVGRVVVAHGLDLARHQPVAGAPPRVGRLA